MNGRPIIRKHFCECTWYLTIFSALTFVYLSWALSSAWKDSWVVRLSDFVRMFFDFETFAVICDKN